MPDAPSPSLPAPWRHRMHTIIFEADTPFGRAFDVVLLLAIIGSTVAVMLETVEPIQEQHGPLLRAIEWGFTILFTVEYVARLVSVERPTRYARSFFGIIDLISFLPTYLSLLIPGAQTLLVVRLLRLLRVFRILKLVRLLDEQMEITRAVWQARNKILVFVYTVLMVVSVTGAIMYLVEHDVNDGFRNMPQGMYWAIVTMTTVGYGDVTPVTVVGKMLASLIILIGYALIVVPTGFVSAELVNHRSRRRRAAMLTTQACPSCMSEGHDADASHCKYCGTELEPQTTPETHPGDHA
ncbi:MAG: ion transporter [Planctomycetota bacterium]